MSGYAERRAALLGATATFCRFAPALADQTVERMRAAYASLRSYADKGTITIEYKNIGGPLVTERHSFVTRYAAPRQFYFEFTKDPNAGQERFVIWCPGETFSWWSVTQVAENYAPGQGKNAFAVGERPTAGTVSLIPPLLFANAGQTGPLVAFPAPTQSGSETLAGRPHHVVTASVHLNHWSDTTRITRLWIDAETMLIGKVFQETPTGSDSGDVQRMTASLESQANPELDEARFNFVAPR